jgi:tetratricopeptide (TPR) repeat protein
MTAQNAFLRGFERYWSDFSISDAKLRTFRVVFFAVLALDCFHQLSHAYRYGLHDFNVSHFPLLDSILPMPHRVAMVTLYLSQAYLAARIALGGASRALYGVLAGLFGLGYFISQLNSYQHHYLLAIAVALCAFFPWPGLRKHEGDRSHWPVRMLQVAFAIMYFYATIAKLTPEWLDGSTLERQMNSAPDSIKGMLDSIGYGNLAWLTVIAEATLAVSVLVRRLWPIAFLVGVPMHLIFEHSGLKIGLFSYFMVSAYSLFVPDGVYEWVAAKTSHLRMPFKAPKRWGLPVLAVALAGGVLLLWLQPFELVLLPASFITVAAAIDAYDQKTLYRAALCHLLALTALLAFHATTDSARDYFRFWGGALRTQGDLVGASEAYERVVELEPDYANGHRHLGDLYRRRGLIDKALDEYRETVLLEEDNWKGYLGLARAFHTQQRGILALEAAEEVLRINPKEETARKIRAYWQQRGVR